MKELSIENIEITNEDVLVTYTPSSGVINYSYIIVKDNINGSPNYVNSNKISNILLEGTGTYKIVITTTNRLGVKKVINSGEYKIDKEAPIINIKNKTYKIKSNQTIDIMEGVTASDIIDGDLTNRITTNIEDIDLSQDGIKTIEYSVSDNAGNKTIETAYITVTPDNTNLIRLGQIGILITITLIILFLIKYIRSIKLEKRFSKYTINSSKNKSISLFDNLYYGYLDFVNKLSKILSKSAFLRKRSNRYDKYECFYNKEYNAMDFMAKKVIIGFIYIIVACIAKLINSSILTLFEMFIPFIIGFYTLDIIYIYKYNIYKKKIENDMLNAITIMNNAFKAGRSIVQSIDLVTIELSGLIAKEFKKIHTEISLGLDVEVAFKRFSDRININEAIYLTSSLSVLNKTGGNIIKVFDSIEKNVFMRKKLQDELKTLTSSSKLITYVLIFVPIIFIIFIGIINREYFSPLFENPLGIFLMLIMLIIYITYIILVKRLMKVRI